MSLAVVTFLWRKPGYHTEFRAEHVNVLRAMVARHYRGPHKFYVVTDGETLESEGGADAFCDDVHIRVGPWHYGDVANPSLPRGPSCYRRLIVWRWDAGRSFRADRIVTLDLDTVIVDDLTPLWDRPEDVVLWRDPLFHNVLYNGSMVLLRAGARPDVYDDFDPVESPRVTKAAKLLGSDQGWISYKLGPGMPTWGREDGVYSFRLMDDPRLRDRAYVDLPTKTDLPDNARIVFFHGRSNPWDQEVQDRYPWVREHWRV